MADSSKSQRLQTIAHTGLTLVAIALILTIAGSFYAASRPVAAISADKLENYQKSLRSYTEESYLLADQYRHGRAPANYTTVSAAKLQQAVSELADNLKTETPEDNVKSAVSKTADEASSLSDTLADLSKAAEEGSPADFTGPLLQIKHEVSKL